MEFPSAMRLNLEPRTQSYGLTGAITSCQKGASFWDPCNVKLRVSDRIVGRSNASTASQSRPRF